MQEGIQECRIFAMALRKFRKDCKISLYTFFRYDSEISQGLQNFAILIFSL